MVNQLVLLLGGKQHMLLKPLTLVFLKRFHYSGAGSLFPEKPRAGVQRRELLDLDWVALDWERISCGCAEQVAES